MLDRGSRVIRIAAVELVDKTVDALAVQGHLGIGGQHALTRLCNHHVGERLAHLSGVVVGGQQ